MITAKFALLKNYDTFICKNRKFTKIPIKEVMQKSCCNFDRKIQINTRDEYGNEYYFCDNEEVVLE